MSIAITIVVALLSAFFLFAGSIKLFAWQKMIFETQMAFMLKYGLSRQALWLIGLVEVIAALIIWFQSTILGVMGASAIFFTSLGALYFHFRFDKWKDAIPAMITFGLSGFVVLQNMDFLLMLIN